MHPITVRRLLFAVLIFLPLQYGTVGLVQLVTGREPWPALVMPGFKATWDGRAPLLASKVSFVAYDTDLLQQQLLLQPERAFA